MSDNKISRNSCEPIIRALLRNEKITANSQLIGYTPDELGLFFNFALRGNYCSNFNFSEGPFFVENFVFLLDFLRRQKEPNDFVKRLKEPISVIVKKLPEICLRLVTEESRKKAWYYAVSIWKNDLLFISNNQIVQALVCEKTETQLEVINHLYILELTNLAVVIGSLVFIEFRRKCVPFEDICRFYGKDICCVALAEKLRTDFNLS